MMRITDLELFRWKWHNEIFLKFKRVQEAVRHLSPLLYWQEYGAFVSVLPRQTGKTMMLGRMIDEVFKNSGENSKANNYLVICPSPQTANRFLMVTGRSAYDVGILPVIMKNVGPITSSFHLFVDDFDSIPQLVLRDLLDHDWASVSMVSTLRR